MKIIFTTVDEYIKSYPENIQKRLNIVRSIIKQKAPRSTESISYGMPAYKTFGKPLVYFGGFENHIGFYATPTGHAEFEKELSEYKQGKGSVQFPNSKKLPTDLIGKIVEFRVIENVDKFKK